MEITELCKLREEFSDATDTSDDKLAGFLTWAGERRLMFHEDGKYLSLAPAFSPQIAANRIREAHTQGRSKKQRART
jgi:hypothetical protein